MIRSLIRRISIPFAWHSVKSVGMWTYCENSITGQRSAHWKGGCFGPMISDFIRHGDIVHGPHGSYVIGEESELWAA